MENMRGEAGLVLKPRPGQGTADGLLKDTACLSPTLSLSFSLCVCLSVSLCVCVCVCVCVFVCMFVCMHVRSSVFLSVSMEINYDEFSSAVVCCINRLNHFV